MFQKQRRMIITVMLAVLDTPKAVEWYQRALGARVMWSMGSVAGLEIEGAPFLLHEPVEGKFAAPEKVGITTVRVEVFLDDPEKLIGRAANAGAVTEEVNVHETPWGPHRQGGFTDPFGHVWLIGDKSPLQTFPPK
jgi:PhnB protein